MKRRDGSRDRSRRQCGSVGVEYISLMWPWMARRYMCVVVLMVLDAGVRHPVRVMCDYNRLTKTDYHRPKQTTTDPSIHPSMSQTPQPSNGRQAAGKQRPSGDET